MGGVCLRSLSEQRGACIAGLLRSESSALPSQGSAGRPLQRLNSRYGSTGYARSEWEEKQILAGYQAVEDLVNMSQVCPYLLA